MLTAKPPAAWFTDPALTEPTPITVTDDGRVYGHAALWGTCHVGLAGACVSPPKSGDGYSSFMLGARRTAEGHDVPVGTVTLATTHAGLKLSAEQTQRHYEDTGRGAAHVVAGEDRWGVWFAGAVTSSASEADVEQLRAGKISGDWRLRSGRLELVGMLAVNTPGFPVPRAALAASAASEANDDDPRTSLVSANVVPRSARLRSALVAGLAAYDAEQRLDELGARISVPELLARFK